MRRGEERSTEEERKGKKWRYEEMNKEGDNKRR